MCPGSGLFALLGYFGTSKQGSGKLSYTCKAATCPDPVLVLFIVTMGRGSLIKVLDDCQDIREVKGHGRTEKSFPGCLTATLWQAW